MTGNDMKTAQNELQLRNKRKEVTKEIIKGGIKMCVGAFFGAIAGYITKDSEMPKFTRYTTIAGGMIVGSMVGDNAANQACLALDQFAEKWTKIQEDKEEQKNAQV